MPASLRSDFIHIVGITIHIAGIATILFLVLPMLLHKETAELVISTQRASGLRKFVEKFQIAANSKTDLLLAIGPRAIAMRALTSRSLALAVVSNLMAVDPATAKAIPMSQTPATAGIPSSVRPLLGAAEKLGAWFAQVSEYEIALLLQVTL